MKLTVTMFQSADGVVQGPGAADEDRSGGFERGGWVAPHFDEDTGAHVQRWFGQADAFLLGRHTYEIFAAHWPQVTDPADPIAAPLNALPKFVPSRTITQGSWAPTTVLGGDLAGEVGALKGLAGRELQVHGSGTLVRALHEHDLVDEYRLLTFPVVLGQGRRLFAERGVATELALLEARTTGSGVAIQVYRPTGRPDFRAVDPG